MNRIIKSAHEPDQNRRLQGLPRPARCAACGGALKRRERPRPLVGLVGDYTLRRAY